MLKIRNTSLSPGVVRIIGLTASMVSFKEASEFLKELAGIRIDPKPVELTTEALGKEIAADEVCFTEPEDTNAITIYLEMDEIEVQKGE